jgi:hypothetical protein
VVSAAAVCGYVLPEVVLSSAGRIPSAFHFFAFSSLLPDNPALVEQAPAHQQQQH